MISLLMPLLDYYYYPFLLFTKVSKDTIYTAIYLISSLKPYLSLKKQRRNICLLKAPGNASKNIAQFFLYEKKLA